MYIHLFPETTFIAIAETYDFYRDRFPKWESGIRRNAQEGSEQPQRSLEVAMPS